MLMIVGHCACTAVYESLCLQKEAVRGDNTCMVIDNDKHASRYMKVYDGICIVISMGHPWIDILCKPKYCDRGQKACDIIIVVCWESMMYVFYTCSV